MILPLFFIHFEILDLDNESIIQSAQLWASPFLSFESHQLWIKVHALLVFARLRLSFGSSEVKLIIALVAEALWDTFVATEVEELANEEISVAVEVEAVGDEIAIDETVVATEVEASLVTETGVSDNLPCLKFVCDDSPCLVLQIWSHSGQTNLVLLKY